ncbi:DNA/RNA non-specific endonuclease [bacterium]|nr:DNA/RNA non-specific endonuclease [bacterium]
MVLDSSINSDIGGIESIRYSAYQPGIYYIRVSSGSASFTSTEPYRLTIHITDTSGAPGFSSPHLALGNPSNAASVIDSTRNYLMEKSQYALSYNSAAGRPNWVSWHLNSSWLGEIPRQDDFRVDVSLPDAWYRVNENDFSGSGYDRGHSCPSGDRTVTRTDNSETFLMSNMIAQAPDNNQGPWADLENYCRDLVIEGKELFVISGGYGANGIVAAGHVSVPARTWKVIVVMNHPGISNISTATRLIGIDMPNVNGIRNDDWKNYRVSVDQIEAATGYDFLSNVSVSIQAVIESAVDNQ